MPRPHAHERFAPATTFQIVEDLEMPGTFGVLLGRWLNDAGEIIDFEISGLPRRSSPNRVRLPLTPGAMCLAIGPVAPPRHSPRED